MIFASLAPANIMNTKALHWTILRVFPYFIAKTKKNSFIRDKVDKMIKLQVLK